VSDSDCPFCEIVRLEDRGAREVYRDSEVVGFFPTEPATLGHTLVVPRAHIPDIWSLEQPVGAALAEGVLRIAHAIRSALRPEGLNIIQSNGEAATQSVMHLHVHLVPRWRGDPVGRIWPPETNFTDFQKDWAQEELIEAIRTRL
jgi:histidine triad (HIT) family protein